MQLSSGKSHKNTSELKTVSSPSTSPLTRLVMPLVVLLWSLWHGLGRLLDPSTVTLPAKSWMPETQPVIDSLCISWMWQLQLTAKGSHKRFVTVVGALTRIGDSRLERLQAVVLNFEPAVSHCAESQSTFPRNAKKLQYII